MEDSQRKGGKAEIPIELYETDRAADYEYNLEEWISEMTDSYQRMGEYEKCISFENEKKRKSKLRDLRILRL